MDRIREAKGNIGEYFNGANGKFKLRIHSKIFSAADESNMIELIEKRLRTI